MPIENDVSVFLHDFKAKLGIWGIFFRDDRGKNLQALLDLDISPAYRMDVIRQLKTEDYSQGPVVEKLHGLPPMWIFGKSVKKKEIYIKITLGMDSAGVICISFHIAERPINYPFKNLGI